MAMGVNKTRCSKVLFMGLIIAGAVYALLALNQVFRVDLSFLRNAQEIQRLYVYTTGSDLAKNSSSNVGKLLETIKLLEARLATGARQQLDREGGAKGRPSDGRRRQVYTDLTAYPFKEDLHYHESTCPKTIASLAQYSKWFKYRYRPKVKVFLDKEDLGNFSDISKHVLPFGYKGENKELLTAILTHQSFTNAPLYRAGRRKQCIRCAVVGCGGILKESGAGPEIDSHDYVFRLNHAVSAGRWENDVGRKTSFYIFFPESMSITSLVDKDAIYIYTMFKTYDINYAVNMLNKEQPPEYIYNGGQKITLPKPNVDPAKLKIVHPDFFRYVFAEYLDSVAYRPTTGAMVVFLALHICDEVAIYGFGYDSRFTMHYYDTKFIQHTDVATGSHDVDNERHLWQKLHDEGVIRLFKRDPL